MTTQAIDARHMSIMHAAVVGAAVVAFLFVLFWASEAAGVGPLPREFVNMFIDGGRQNLWAQLLGGMPKALLLGALAGAAIAVFANLFRFLDRR